MVNFLDHCPPVNSMNFHSTQWWAKWRLSTFDLYPWGEGHGVQGQICDILRPQLAMNRFLPLWSHRFPHFVYINLRGEGVGGALILDRCRAFDLFASVDVHLCQHITKAEVFWQTKRSFLIHASFVCKVKIRSLYFTEMLHNYQNTIDWELSLFKMSLLPNSLLKSLKSFIIIHPFLQSLSSRELSLVSGHGLCWPPRNGHPLLPEGREEADVRGCSKEADTGTIGQRQRDSSARSFTLSSYL